MPNSISFLVMTRTRWHDGATVFRSPTKSTTFLTVSSAAPCGCAGGFGKSTSRLPTENQIYNVRGSWELSLGNKKMSMSNLGLPAFVGAGAGAAGCAGGGCCCVCAFERWGWPRATRVKFKTGWLAVRNFPEISFKESPGAWCSGTFLHAKFVWWIISKASGNCNY